MKRVLAWAALIVGLWLSISPWFLNYQAGLQRGHDVVFGAVVMISALMVVLRKEDGIPSWPYWTSGVVGLWLIISGICVFGAIMGANPWYEIIPGILILLLSLLATQIVEGQSVKMVDSRGTPLVEISKLERRGTDLVMRGKIMNSMPTTVYVRPEEACKMLGLVTVEIVRFLPLFLFLGIWRLARVFRR